MSWNHMSRPLRQFFSLSASGGEGRGEVALSFSLAPIGGEGRGEGAASKYFEIHS